MTSMSGQRFDTSRSTGLRVQVITFDTDAWALLNEVLVKNAPARFIAERPVVHVGG